MHACLTAVVVPVHDGVRICGSCGLHSSSAAIGREPHAHKEGQELGILSSSSGRGWSRLIVVEGKKGNKVGIRKNGKVKVTQKIGEEKRKERQEREREERSEVR
jgi:hypothetical protein